MIRKDLDHGSAPSAIDEVDEINVNLAESLRPLHQHPFSDTSVQTFRLTNLHCLIESGRFWIPSSETRACSPWSFPGKSSSPKC